MPGLKLTKYVWFKIFKQIICMETRKEVKTIEVDFSCPKCNKGFLRPTNVVLSIYPPSFPHVCNNNECGYNENFGVHYPYIEYISVDLSKSINH